MTQMDSEACLKRFSKRNLLAMVQVFGEMIMTVKILMKGTGQRPM